VKGSGFSVRNLYGNNAHPKTACRKIYQSSSEYVSLEKADLSILFISVKTKARNHKINPKGTITYGTHQTSDD
jgi:hypothetical protein